MRYFVTGQPQLFESKEYKVISVEESLKLLEPMRRVGLDTETLKLDVFTGTLILAQLGNKEIQVAIDCTTIDIKRYKEFLESDRLFIIHNAKFDLRWFYKEGIIIKNVFDTYLAERILYLGFPPGIISLSLQACCKRYLNVFLDKSVRGEIYKGLSEEVIVYGCNDVVYLEEVMNFQITQLKERGQLVAIDVENHFVKVLAYIEYNGLKLDTERWKAKMATDKDRLDKAKSALDEWLVNYCIENKINPVGWELVYIDTNFKAINEVQYEESLLPKGWKRRPHLDNGKIQAYAIPTGCQWIKIDRQGDLFSGFQEKPTCCIKWSSSKQVAPVLEHLGFDLWVRDKKTGKNRKSVEIKVIRPQMNKSSIAPLYIEYSAAAKVVDSFGENFLKAINPVTHRIHATYNQLMDTGERLPHITYDLVNSNIFLIFAA